MRELVMLTRLGAVFTLALTLLSAASISMAPHAGSGKVDLVVVGEPGAQGALLQAARRLGGRPGRLLDLINGFELTLPVDRVPSLASSPGAISVSFNRSLRPQSAEYSPTGDIGSLYNTTTMIGARQAWSSGITGRGVDVALIDSGVVPVQGLSGADKIVNGADVSFESQSSSTANLDTYGHGTHLAGIIAGRDQVQSPEEYAADGTSFLGVAPDARIVSVKAANSHGASDVTQVIAGIDWVVKHRHDNGLNIRVINLSYGTDSAQPALVDPLSFAVEQAWLQGIAVIVAAGNDGMTSLGLSNPAHDPLVIAVGAADTHGTTAYSGHTVAGFSDYGNVARNPDLIAPGVHLESLRNPGSYIDLRYGATAQVGDRYFRGSGTSQAAAIVTGAAALLLQAHPEMTPDQLKYMLKSTADRLSGGLLSAPSPSQGSGEIDLFRAMQAPVSYYRQWSVHSLGGGSIELSRGTHRVVMDGVTLTGEQDVFGRYLNSVALAGQEISATSWNLGNWNGSTWTGSTWTGSTWTGSTWTGSTWTGSTWTGSTWTGSTWTGSTWTGSTWTGSTWTGSTWTGSTWTGSTWSSAGWS